MEKQPIYGENFLLSFDYKFPSVPKKIQNILYIHSTRINQSKTVLKRLMEIFPNANFYVLQNKDVELDNDKLSNSNIIFYNEKVLPKDFHQTAEGTFLIERTIDIVFFGANLDIRLGDIDPLNSYVAKPYENILEVVKNLNLYDWTVIIDNQFCVFYPWQIEWDRVHGIKKFQIDEVTLSLPWTLLSQNEKEALFKLGRSGPSNGSIVNIGYFQGGSSIILAGGSKASKREKIYAFDIEEQAGAARFVGDNGLEDWIVFQKENSVDAAQKWSTQENNKIRLLLIDGDHSYEGCKADILSWSRFIAPGGIIAIHDYGNVSEGAKYSEVVEAVYDTILNNSEFQCFRRIDTLFMATKI